MAESQEGFLSPKTVLEEMKKNGVTHVLASPASRFGEAAPRRRAEAGELLLCILEHRGVPVLSLDGSPEVEGAQVGGALPDRIDLRIAEEARCLGVLLIGSMP